MSNDSLWEVHYPAANIGRDVWTFPYTIKEIVLGIEKKLFKVAELVSTLEQELVHIDNESKNSPASSNYYLVSRRYEIEEQLTNNKKEMSNLSQWQRMLRQPGTSSTQWLTFDDVNYFGL